MKIEERSKTYNYTEAGVDYIEVVDTVRIEAEGEKDHYKSIKEQSKYNHLGYSVVASSTDRHYNDIEILKRSKRTMVLPKKIERDFDGDDCICHLIRETCNSCAERA